MSRGHTGGGRSGGFSGGSGVRSSGFRSSHTSINFGFWWPALFMGRRTSSSGDSSDASQNNVKYKKVRRHLPTLIVTGIFAALCIMFVVFACNHSFSREYTKVSAVVTTVDTDLQYDGYYWFTSYDFDFNGERISVESQLSWSMLEGVPESAGTFAGDPLNNSELMEIVNEKYIGHSFDIYVKNSDPYIIYEIEGRGEIPSTNAGYIAGAVIMGVIGLIIALVGINKYEVDKEAMATIEAQKTTVVPDGKCRCAYCGALNDKDINKCTTCGAPLK